MIELLSVLMCGGGRPATPPPPPMPAPAKAPAKKAPTAVKQKQDNVTAGLGTASGFGGTLLTGLQGIGDQQLTTGKSILGG